MSNVKILSLARFTVAAVAAAHCALGAAQIWPERAVRIVIPFPAGTGVDVAARLIADKLTPRLGKSFIADNRPGANGIIGTEIVAKSAPDGYTLLAAGNTTHAANPSLYKSLPYDSLKDFAPVAFMVGLDYYLVVGAGTPARNVQELIAYAKSNPGRLSYATGNTSWRRRRRLRGNRNHCCWGPDRSGPRSAGLASWYR
jgi:tripartite-type tricarboxylate transporter receptor subunit TctC